MSQPLETALSKTMFVVEGNPTALLVTDGPRGMSKNHYWFPAPEYALAWCRKHGCNLVYYHIDIAGN